MPVWIDQAGAGSADHVCSHEAESGVIDRVAGLAVFGGDKLLDR
jgi:hypothetical protein